MGNGQSSECWDWYDRTLRRDVQRAEDAKGSPTIQWSWFKRVEWSVGTDPNSAILHGNFSTAGFDFWSQVLSWSEVRLVVPLHKSIPLTRMIIVPPERLKREYQTPTNQSGVTPLTILKALHDFYRSPPGEQELALPLPPIVLQSSSVTHITPVPRFRTEDRIPDLADISIRSYLGDRTWIRDIRQEPGFVLVTLGPKPKFS